MMTHPGYHSRAAISDSENGKYRRKEKNTATNMLVWLLIQVRTCPFICERFVSGMP